jgi:hypothetical protein
LLKAFVFLVLLIVLLPYNSSIRIAGISRQPVPFTYGANHANIQPGPRPKAVPTVSGVFTPNLEHLGKKVVPHLKLGVYFNEAPRNIGNVLFYLNTNIFRHELTSKEKQKHTPHKKRGVF